MQYIQNNKLYDTETSNHIGSDHFGSSSDLDYLHHDLYKTQKGSYFMIVNGGPNSKMNYQTAQNEFIGRSHISVLTVDEAMEWSEEYLEADDYLKLFSEFIEEA